MAPPQVKPNFSVARVSRAWYVACASEELGAAPLSRDILGMPLVLFRGASGAPAALLDRCAHRNVPLSLGRVTGESLQCGYHGWEYGGDGICRKVPGLCGVMEGAARRVPSYPCREQDGYVWVWATADDEPDCEPYTLPLVGDGRYTTVRREVRAPSSIHGTLENALDVPHTAFLHAQLFRGAGEPNDIDVVVRRGTDRVEAQFIGEPRPEGIVGRILAPGGGEVEHYDRFLLPSIGQVEYRLGDDMHMMITSLCTPVTDFDTRIFAVVSFRTRLPGWLLKIVLMPLALKIFQQDVEILRAQTEAVHRFGGEQYVSTDVDILGGPIWRLLKAAERGEVDQDAEPEERRLRIRV